MNNLTNRPLTTDNEEGLQVYCYDIWITGLFGRNRKVKHDSFELAKHLDQPLTNEQALSLMEAKLKSIKLKGEYTFKLTRRIGKLKNESGYQIYSTDLFGGVKTLYIGKGNTINGSQEGSLV